MNDSKPLQRAHCVALLTACSWSLHGCRLAPRTLDTRDAAGVYALIPVDGKGLPAIVEHGSDSVEVRAGQLEISADGLCQSTTVFVPPSGSVITREVQAACVVDRVVDGERWTMRWRGAGTTTGMRVGATFTMHNEGLNFVYRK